MNILKYIGYIILSGVALKLLGNVSIVQFIIVLALCILGVYFFIKHQLFWKIYSYVFLLITLLVTVGFIFIEYEIIDYISIPFSIVSCVGIFAFAYKKVVLSRLFWIAILFIDVLFLIIPFGEETSIIQDINEFGLVGGTIYLVFYVYLFLVHYLGLFLYAFYSVDIWNDDDTKKIVASEY